MRLATTAQEMPALSQIMGERRNVTVLFADLCDYTTLAQTLEDEVLYQLIQNLMKLLANAVVYYEGTVDKLTGDGIMALFGAPIAHENNAERAIRSALKMQADVRQLNQNIADTVGVELRLHIGLNSGSVIVGSISPTAGLDYTAIGDTVNLANRLLSIAGPETIVVSESVYRQTKALFEYSALPSQTVKGFLQPIQPYHVIGLKSRPGSVRGIEGLKAPMIGRQRELEHLLNLVGQILQQNCGGVAVVVGQAGIGKSRLTSEFKTHLDAQKIRWIEGRSLTYRKSASYWIFQDLLRSSLNSTQDDLPEKVLEKLSKRCKELLGKGAADSQPYLEYLLFSENNASLSMRFSYLDPGQLRQRIFLAVRDFLIAESQQKPLVLIFEDLHWADKPSLELLTFLLDSLRQTPILVYAITRPYENDEMADFANQAQQKLPNSCQIIRLSALEKEQSSQLFHALLSIPDIPQQLIEKIIGRAAGIPFYLEEILRKLIEEKIVENINGHWVLTSGSDIEHFGVPETLQDLILDRFDRLNALQRRVLQIASVIGNQFELNVLEKVIQQLLPDKSAIDCLQNLQELNFIEPQDIGGHKKYAFRHVLVSDAIYSTLLKRDRSELHGCVAEVLESIYADRIESQLEFLASHYLRSNHRAKALQYALLAAQKSSQRYANEQARQYFEQTLTLFAQTSYTTQQYIEAQIGLGDVLVIVGEYQAARDHYQAALDVITTSNDINLLARASVVQRKIATSFERQGDFDKALSRLILAQEELLPGSVSFSTEQAYILHDIGWIHFRRGNLVEAESYLLKAMVFVQNTDRYDIQASIFNRLGGVYFRKGDLDQAGEYTRRSLELREQIGDLLGAARSSNNLGLISYARGRWNEALQSLQRDLSLQARLGDNEEVIMCHRNIAELQIDLGNFEEAGKHCLESLHLAQQIGAQFHIAAANTTLGRFHLVKGEYIEAQHFLSISEKIYTSLNAKEPLLDVYHLYGETLLGMGQLEQAAQQAQRMMEILSQLGTGPLSMYEARIRAFLLLGRISIAQKDWSAAQTHLQTGLNIAQNSNNRYEIARLQRELAEVLASEEKIAEAYETLDAAANTFRELGAYPDYKLAMNKKETLV
jgi:predicted ATPase/class 3 adenylate cyclase